VFALCAQRDAIGRKAKKCFLDRYDLEKNALQLLAFLEAQSAAPGTPFEIQRQVTG